MMQAFSSSVSFNTVYCESSSTTGSFQTACEVVPTSKEQIWQIKNIEIWLA